MVARSGAAWLRPSEGRVCVCVCVSSVCVCDPPSLFCLHQSISTSPPTLYSPPIKRLNSVEQVEEAFGMLEANDGADDAQVSEGRMTLCA
jgi:hypothetical protein